MPVHSPYTRLFSSGSFGVLVILLAWLNKCWMSFLHWSMVGDKSIFALMTKNAIRGNGFTETFYFLEQPGKVFYFSNNAINSPGYSFLLAFPLWLTNDLFLSSFIIDAGSWVIFILAIRALLKQAGAALHTINLASLLTGFFIYPHEGGSNPKDTLAIALLLWALYLFIRAINKPHLLIEDGLLPGLFFMLPGIIKLTYIPIAFAFLVVLGFFIFYKKENGLKKLLYGAVTSVLLLTVMLYGWIKVTQPEIPGEFLPAIARTWEIVSSPQELGFNIFNITLIYPFIPASFINMEIAGTIMVSGLSLPVSRAHIISVIFNFLLLLGLLFYFIRYLLRQYKKPFVSDTSFVIAGGVISLSIFILMLLIAVLLSPIIYKGSNGSAYTYASESRPFIFILVFLQLLFFIRLWNASATQFSGFWKIIRILLFALLTIHAIHGFVFSGKKAVSVLKGEQPRRSDQYHTIMSTIDSVKNAYPEKNISIVTEISHLRWLLLLDNKVVYADPLTLEKKDISLSPGEIRVVVLFKEDLTLFSNYLLKKSVARLYDSPQYLILGEGTE